MKNILLFFLIFTINFTCLSQKKKTKELELKYTFKTIGETNKISFTCLVPNDIKGSQKVKKISYSVDPVNVFANKDNKYAEFIFDSVNQDVELTIGITIDIYRRDFKTSKKNPFHQITSLDTFLIEEKYIELSDVLIRKIADDLKNKDTIKMVKNIYNYVYNNLKYSGFNSADIGAVEALKRQHGDCTEFTDLFVALCRANGIPAKAIEGYTTEFENTPKHSWSEIYLEKHGWIRLDPTPNNAISFSQLSNKYIQLSCLRSDKKLNNYHRWKYRYWGGKVSVSEKIRFIN